MHYGPLHSKLSGTVFDALLTFSIIAGSASAVNAGKKRKNLGDRKI